MLLDFVYVPLIIILGLLICRWANLKNKDRRFLRYLFFYHLSLGLYYCFFLFGDANTYWNISRELSFNELLEGLKEINGTKFMHSFNYIFADLLQMSYLSNTLLFSLFGFIGFVFFYFIALETIPYNKIVKGYPLFPIIFFLPNLHIWSVAIGKDTLLFLAISMISYGILKIHKRYVLTAIGLVVGFAVRPHIVLFILIAFGIVYIFNKSMSTGKRFFFVVLFLFILISILPLVLKYINLESIDSKAISIRAGIQANNLNVDSGSGVDVNSYPFIYKVFTYLYRPLFFDANSFGSLLSSVDNLMLLLLSWFALKYKPIQTFSKAPLVLRALFLFAIIGTVAFSISLGNLGIMIRMKNMFTPGVLVYFMWCLSYQQSKPHFLEKK